MKRTASLTAFTLVFFASAALAADLPARKAPPIMPPPPPPLWTGFYAGLNAGYGFGTSNNVGTVASGWDEYFHAYQDPRWNWVAKDMYTVGYGGLFLANSGRANVDQNGFAGGGQIGYNYQWGKSIVVGLEADIQGAGINGAGSYAGVGVDSYTMMGMPHGDRVTTGVGSIQAKLNWFGTVRGRLGYLFTPTLLVYATGGLTYGGAQANVNSISSSTLSGPMIWYGGMAGHTPTSINQVAAGAGQASSTLVGWNVGGGLEWMFMPNWSLKGEAFYYDLGSLDVTGAAIAPASGNAANMGMIINDAQAIYTTSRINYAGVIARAGVNYHFNWGAAAPVVASY